MEYDLSKIIEKISEAAHTYQENLIGKTFLYVFDSRYIEVRFHPQNFKHLTGVDTALYAKDFFKQSLYKKLKTTNISFSKRFPIKNCKQKLKHINNIAVLARGESFMLQDISTKTERYLFGTTNLNFTMCLGNSTDKPDLFFPKSLRDGDSFSKSRDVYVITHIFSKPNDAKAYDTLLYLDKGQSISILPNEIKLMLTDDLQKTEQRLCSCKIALDESDKIIESSDQLKDLFEQAQKERFTPNSTALIESAKLPTEQLEIATALYKERNRIIMSDKTLESEYVKQRNTYRGKQKAQSEIKTFEQGLNKLQERCFAQNSKKPVNLSSNKPPRHGR